MGRVDSSAPSPSTEGVGESALGALIRNAFDLDFAVHHHGRLHTGAGGRGGAEILGVDFVEGPEIARVVEPDAASDDVFDAVSAFEASTREDWEYEIRALDD